MSSLYDVPIVGEVMNFIIPKPEAPKLPMPAAAKPITTDTTAVKEAARLESERMKKRRGLASTILTGPQGLTGQNPSLLKTVLG